MPSNQILLGYKFERDNIVNCKNVIEYTYIKYKYGIEICGTGISLSGNTHAPEIDLEHPTGANPTF